MTQPMHTDDPVLIQSAADYDRISGELQSRLRAIEAEADALMPSLQGQTGTAAQQAAARYNEAANAEINELQTISQNIHHSGVQYSSSDAGGSDLVNAAFPHR